MGIKKRKYLDFRFPKLIIDFTKHIPLKLLSQDLRN
jgi:hypothetical protein